MKLFKMVKIVLDGNIPAFNFDFVYHKTPLSTSKPGYSFVKNFEDSKECPMTDYFTSYRVDCIQIKKSSQNFNMENENFVTK